MGNFPRPAAGGFCAPQKSKKIFENPIDIRAAGAIMRVTIKQSLNCLRVYRLKFYCKGVFPMKKTYKIDVDCANCANKMEGAAKKTAGVKDAVVNFMTLKMNVEFEEGQDPKAVMQQVRKNCKRVESDCEVYL